MDKANRWDDEKGWVPVSIADLKGNSSGPFQCRKCSYSVRLVRGPKQIPHFRHCKTDHGETDDCELRRFGVETGSVPAPRCPLPLPLRLRRLNDTQFRLSVGFPPLSREFLKENATLSIKIHPNGERGKFDPRYRLERFIPDRWTYLKLDGMAERYEVEVPDGLAKQWRRYSMEVRLFLRQEPEGRFFSDSGKSLPVGAEVQCGRTYLLLTRQGGSLPTHNPDSVDVRECCKMGNWQIWNVRATRFNESAATFFSEYGLNLRHHAIRTVTLWPVCFQGEHQIYKPQERELFVFLRYDSRSSVQLRFEGACVNPFRRHSSQQANEMYHLPSTGKHLEFLHSGTPLKYEELQPHSLDLRGTMPPLEVTDIYDEPVFPGITERQPSEGRLKIRAGCKGFVEILRGTTCVKRRNFNGSETVEVENVEPGRTLRVWLGMDMVWELKVQALPESQAPEANPPQPRAARRMEETALLSQLRARTGRRGPIPFEAGTLAHHLRRFPKLRAWLLENVRNQGIDETAWKILKNFVKKEMRK